MLYAVSLSRAKIRLLMSNYTVAFPSVNDTLIINFSGY